MEMDLVMSQLKDEGGEEVLVVRVVIEVVLGEVELDVRVRVLDPSQRPRNRYQLGLVEAGIEVGFEWRRFLEGGGLESLQRRSVAG
ncbi:hypothetical protein ACLOJK_004521 [Asimina triloba]